MVDLRDSVLEAPLVATGDGSADSVDNDHVVGGLDTDLCGDGTLVLVRGEVRCDLRETFSHVSFLLLVERVYTVVEC